MTVLNGDGLVGRVKTSGPSTSTVLLAIDPDSRSACGSRARWRSASPPARATGPGAGPALLDGQSTVSAGDRLVTFGSQGDRPYVPGVPVGYVVSVDGTPGLTDPHRRRPAVRRLHLARPRGRRRRAAAERPAGRRAAAAAGARPMPTVTVTGDAASRTTEEGRWADVPARDGCCSPCCCSSSRSRVQVSVLARLPLPGATPDLLLLAVVALALATGRASAWSPASRPGWLADLAPPADHAVGRWALVLCSSATSPGWRRARRGARRSYPCSWSSLSSAAASVLLYAGLGALIDDPHVTWRRGERVAAHRGSLRRGR